MTPEEQKNTICITMFACCHDMGNLWKKKHSVEFLLSFYYMYTIFKSSIHLAVCAAQSHEERNISPLIIQAQSMSVKKQRFVWAKYWHQILVLFTSYRQREESQTIGCVPS